MKLKICESWLGDIKGICEMTGENALHGAIDDALVISNKLGSNNQSSLLIIEYTNTLRSLLSNLNSLVTEKKVSQF